jgi:ketosteroid isomerase-like protein
MVHQYFRSLFSRRRVRFAFTSSEIELAGDVAVERVTYVASTWPAAGGAAAEDVGKGLHVYRREAGGSWKLAQDIWNSDTAAPPSG